MVVAVGGWGNLVSIEFDELQQRALQLSPAERADLAYRLLQSIDEGEADDEALSSAWQIEIERRIGEIDRGEVAMIPGDDVLADARRLLG